MFDGNCREEYIMVCLELGCCGGCMDRREEDHKKELASERYKGLSPFDPDLLPVWQAKIRELQLDIIDIKKDIQEKLDTRAAWVKAHGKEHPFEGQPTIFDEDLKEAQKQLKKFKYYSSGSTPAGPPKDTFNIDAIKENVLIEHIMPDNPVIQTSSRDKYLCPFHAEKTPSFVVYKKDNRAHCFGCDWSGDVIQVYRDLHSIGFRQACHLLSDLT